MIPSKIAQKDFQHFFENDFKNGECDCNKLIFHPLGSMNQCNTHTYITYQFSVSIVCFFIVILHF